MNDHNDPSADSVSNPGVTVEKRLTYLLLYRTIVAISSVAVVILVVAGWIIDNRRFTETYSAMEQDVGSLKAALESIMMAPVANKRVRAQGYLIGEGKEHNYVNLNVFSLDTQVVFSKNTSELGQKLDLRRMPRCRNCHGISQPEGKRQFIYLSENGERVYHFVLPMENKEACQQCHDPSEPRCGILIVDFSLRELDEQIKNSRVDLVVTLSITSVVFVAFTFILLQSIAYKPLEVIAGRLKRIAAGDFSPAPSHSRKGIIGFINGQIDRTAERLKKSYDDLESRVQERTGSLRLSRKALAEEKDKLQFILDNSPQGLLGLSPEGIILFANNKAGEFVGIPQKELVNKSVKEFELLRQVFDGTVVRSTIDENIVSIGTEHIFSTGEHLRYFDVQAARVTTQRDETILLVMLIDVTEKKKLDQNLERHERLASIGQLAAGVAHEVGNPLSAISSLVQITQKVNEPETLHHNLNLITYHIERISKIVRNLSDFARVPDEKVIATSIFDIVRGAVEIASFDSRAGKVRIELSRPETDIVLNVRRDQLLQAVLNIIMNAFDAMEKTTKPELKISVSPWNEGCSISISDTGKGIKEEHKERVFEPFYTTKPAGKGTGLGLSVTYRIITEMGGNLVVDSKVSEGSTFTIRLQGSVSS